jgi:hypothetical protein
MYRLKNIQLYIMVIVILITVLLVLNGISSYDDNFTESEVDRVKETVEKYIVQCYATEGAYPPNIAYLSEHYGLILNEDKYIYEYEPVAENIKPIVQIFIRLDYK